MTKSTQVAEVAGQLEDAVVREVEVLEQRERRGQVERHDFELVVRRVEIAQSGQLGEVVNHRQPVERDVQPVQLTQLEQFIRQRL